MGATHTGYIMTLANSIIGVGILAMPFCFQKCGIILSILLLVLSNMITRLCCHYLLKASIFNRKRTYEMLAFHIFGPSGKLTVELCLIGYLMGTCIAYFVVVGDLGPQIVSKLFSIEITDSLRTWVMAIVTVVCIIPLGLLRNLESLSHVCTTSMVFYLCLVVKVIAESKPHISAGDWYSNVALWKPSGITQCLPILVMATSCQTNVFEVYDSLPNPTLQKMNEIIKSATNLCTGAYVLVGFFGYVAFSSSIFSGNIMLNFAPSIASDIIKLGFVLSVACSFPLLIFPGRASLNSLLYRRSYTEAAHYIPEHRFRLITVSMIVSALLIGLMIPSIELVIGLAGSTIGVGICIMFPAACYVKGAKKDTTEKLLAQTILVFGFIIMILGTYANLNAIDEKKSGADIDKMLTAQQEAVAPVPPNQLPSAEDLLQNSMVNNVVIAQNMDKFSEPHPAVLEKLKEIDKSEPVVDKIPKISPAINEIENAKIPEVASNKEVVNPKTREHIQEPIAQIPPTTTPSAKPDLSINRDAIQKEDQEMAIENKEKLSNQAKELVQEVRDQLKKEHEETRKLLEDKLDNMSKKIDNRVQPQNELANNKTAEAQPQTVVRLTFDSKENPTNLYVYKTNDKKNENVDVPHEANADHAESANLKNISRLLSELPPEKLKELKIERIPSNNANIPSKPLPQVRADELEKQKTAAADNVKSKQKAAKVEADIKRDPAPTEAKVAVDAGGRDLLSVKAPMNELSREKRNAPAEQYNSKTNSSQPSTQTKDQAHVDASTLNQPLPHPKKEISTQGTQLDSMSKSPQKPPQEVIPSNVQPPAPQPVPLLSKSVDSLPTIPHPKDAEESLKATEVSNAIKDLLINTDHKLFVRELKSITENQRPYPIYGQAATTSDYS